MDKIHVVTIAGDGIGKEIMPATLRVLEATGLPFEWIPAEAGLETAEKYGEALPRETLNIIDRVWVALKSPTATPVGQGHRSINVALRQHFNLDINMRPSKSWPGVRTRCPGMDVILFRQNTEGLYVGDEHYDSSKDFCSSAFATSKVTRAAAENIFEYAFLHAFMNGRKKVTAVHKGNILKITEGDLFKNVGEKIAKKYPTIEFEDLITDNFAFQAVARLPENPKLFDVVVAPNMTGDVLSDLLAGMATCSLGFAAGANIGVRVKIYEAVHGTAPDIARQNKANPCALILSGAMMLDHLGKVEEAKRIRKAIGEVLKEGKFVTGDINPKNPVSTNQMTNEIICKMIKD